MLRILLADDSMTAQNMGKKILTDAGYDVVAVSNGAAAVKKLPEVNPDIVLLDIYMPGYNGLEVCELMKSDPQTEHIPVLLTVGKLEPFRPEDGMRVKAEGVVIKPFEATDLLTVVGRMAERIPAAAASQPPAPHTSLPNTASIPEYDDYDEAEPSPSEQRVAVPLEAAAIPAFGDDLLPSAGTEIPNSYQPAEPFPQTPGFAPAAASSTFGEFEIELEPIPLEPATNLASQPEYAASAAVSSAAFPIEFELEKAERPLEPEPQQTTADQVLEFAPFVPEAPTPGQAESEARFEAAMAAFAIPASDQTASIVVDAANSPELEYGKVTETVESSQPEHESVTDAELVDDLSSVMREALATVERAQAAEHHEEGFSTEYELDIASAAEASTTSALRHTARAGSVQIPEAAAPDAMGTIIDLDNLLGEPAVSASPVSVLDSQSAFPEQSIAETPAAHEELAADAQDSVTTVESEAQEEAAVPAPLAEAGMAPEEVATPSATASGEDDFDVNQAIAERVVERVLERLRPQLIEEIRNVLKEM